MKTPAHLHKDLAQVGKCKLHVCGDYRAVNSQIAKIVPNLPTGLVEVEKAAGHLHYWESDSVACYSQFTLAPGPSREALAIWTPLGLVQPTTLPFGQKNSGTEAQPRTIPRCGCRNASRPVWKLRGRLDWVRE